VRQKALPVLFATLMTVHWHMQSLPVNLTPFLAASRPV